MIKGLTCAMLGIGALAITSATAAEPSKGAAQQACKADVERFCASVQRGDGRIRKCLSENKEQLSTPCKEAMQRAASQQLGRRCGSGRFSGRDPCRTGRTRRPGDGLRRSQPGTMPARICAAVVPCSDQSVRAT